MRADIEPPTLLHNGAGRAAQHECRQSVAEPVLRHLAEQLGVGAAAGGVALTAWEERPVQRLAEGETLGSNILHSCSRLSRRVAPGDRPTYAIVAEVSGTGTNS